MKYNFAQIKFLFKPVELLKSNTFVIWKFLDSLEICLFRIRLSDPVLAFNVSLGDNISPDLLFDCLSNNPAYSHIDVSQVKDMAEISIPSVTTLDSVQKRCLGLTTKPVSETDNILSPYRSLFPTHFSTLFYNPYASLPNSTLPFEYCFQTSCGIENDLLYFSKSSYVFRFSKTYTYVLSSVNSNQVEFFLTPNPFCLFSFLNKYDPSTPAIFIRYLVFGKDIPSHAINTIFQNIALSEMKYSFLYSSSLDLIAIISFLCRCISFSNPFSVSFTPSNNMLHNRLLFSFPVSETLVGLSIDQLLSDFSSTFSEMYSFDNDPVSFLTSFTNHSFSLNNTQFIEFSFPNHLFWLKSVAQCLISFAPKKFTLTHI